jgi:pyruvate formate lyase activating enzyme
MEAIMNAVNRREFLKTGVFWTAAMGCPTSAHALWPFSASEPNDNSDSTGRVFPGDAPEKLWQWSREALHYRRLESKRVQCQLCPHRCLLDTGDRSLCRSRVNIDGVLYTLVYGNPCAVHVDPVEKKPLYHFIPGTTSFSIATTGCNLRCLNCQNWEISQAKPHEVRYQSLFPKEVVAAAKSAGVSSVAYTYSEPITFFEYTFDTATEAKSAGLHNVLVSAGYINREPLEALCRLIDGANINLKSFDDGIYRRLNGARLQPILETFETLHRQGIHFEMTHLVVPGYTDDEKMVKAMCRWILQTLGPDHPLHFIRFFPRYKLDRLPPTPTTTLIGYRELAMAEGIRYVYVGNVPEHEGNHTFCHHCGKLLIERQGYTISQYHLTGNVCRFCQTRIPGIWPAEKTENSNHL